MEDPKTNAVASTSRNSGLEKTFEGLFPKFVNLAKHIRSIICDEMTAEDVIKCTEEFVDILFNGLIARNALLRERKVFVKHQILLLTNLFKSCNQLFIKPDLEKKFYKLICKAHRVLIDMEINNSLRGKESDGIIANKITFPLLNTIPLEKNYLLDIFPCLDEVHVQHKEVLCILFDRFFKPEPLPTPIKLDDIAFVRYMVIYKTVYKSKDSSLHSYRSDFVNTVSQFIAPRNRLGLKSRFNLKDVDNITVKHFLESVGHNKMKDVLRIMIEDENKPTETIEVDLEQSPPSSIQIKQEKNFESPVELPEFVIDLTEDDEDEMEPNFSWLNKYLDKGHLLNELNKKRMNEAVPAPTSYLEILDSGEIRDLNEQPSITVEELEPEPATVEISVENADKSGESAEIMEVEEPIVQVPPDVPEIQMPSTAPKESQVVQQSTEETPKKIQEKPVETPTVPATATPASTSGGLNIVFSAKPAKKPQLDNSYEDYLLDDDNLAPPEEIPPNSEPSDSSKAQDADDASMDDGKSDENREDSASERDAALAIIQLRDGFIFDKSSENIDQSGDALEGLEETGDGKGGSTGKQPSENTSETPTISKDNTTTISDDSESFSASTSILDKYKNSMQNSSHTVVFERKDYVPVNKTSTITMRRRTICSSKPYKKSYRDQEIPEQFRNLVDKPTVKCKKMSPEEIEMHMSWTRSQPFITRVKEVFVRDADEMNGKEIAARIKKSNLQYSGKTVKQQKKRISHEKISQNVIGISGPDDPDLLVEVKKSRKKHVKFEISEKDLAEQGPSNREILKQRRASTYVLEILKKEPPKKTVQIEAPKKTVQVEVQKDFEKPKHRERSKSLSSAPKPISTRSRGPAEDLPNVTEQTIEHTLKKNNEVNPAMARKRAKSLYQPTPSEPKTKTAESKTKPVEPKTILVEPKSKPFERKTKPVEPTTKSVEERPEPHVILTRPKTYGNKNRRQEKSDKKENRIQDTSENKTRRNLEKFDKMIAKQPKVPPKRRKTFYSDGRAPEPLKCRRNSYNSQLREDELDSRESQGKKKDVTEKLEKTKPLKKRRRTEYFELDRDSLSGDEEPITINPTLFEAPVSKKSKQQDENLVEVDCNFPDKIGNVSVSLSLTALKDPLLRNLTKQKRRCTISEPASKKRKQKKSETSIENVKQSYTDSRRLPPEKESTPKKPVYAQPKNQKKMEEAESSKKSDEIFDFNNDLSDSESNLKEQEDFARTRSQTNIKISKAGTSRGNQVVNSKKVVKKGPETLYHFIPRQKSRNKVLGTMKKKSLSVKRRDGDVPASESSNSIPAEKTFEPLPAESSPNVSEEVPEKTQEDELTFPPEQDDLMINLPGILPLIDDNPDPQSMLSHEFENDEEMNANLNIESMEPSEKPEEPQEPKESTEKQEESVESTDSVEPTDCTTENEYLETTEVNEDDPLRSSTPICQIIPTEEPNYTLRPLSIVVKNLPISDENNVVHETEEQVENVSKDISFGEEEIEARNEELELEEIEEEMRLAVNEMATSEIEMHELANSGDNERELEVPGEEQPETVEKHLMKSVEEEESIEENPMNVSTQPETEQEKNQNSEEDPSQEASKNEEAEPEHIRDKENGSKIKQQEADSTQISSDSDQDQDVSESEEIKKVEPEIPPENSGQDEKEEEENPDKSNGNPENDRPEDYDTSDAAYNDSRIITCYEQQEQEENEEQEEYDMNQLYTESTDQLEENDPESCPIETNDENYDEIQSGEQVVFQDDSPMEEETFQDQQETNGASYDIIVSPDGNFLPFMNSAGQVQLVAVQNDENKPLGRFLLKLPDGQIMCSNHESFPQYAQLMEQQGEPGKHMELYEEETEAVENECPDGDNVVSQVITIPTMENQCNDEIRYMDSNNEIPHLVVDRVELDSGENEMQQVVETDEDNSHSNQHYVINNEMLSNQSVSDQSPFKKRRKMSMYCELSAQNDIQEVHEDENNQSSNTGSAPPPSFNNSGLISTFSTKLPSSNHVCIVDVNVFDNQEGNVKSMMAQQPPDTTEPRKRGRPKGSKNKVVTGDDALKPKKVYQKKNTVPKESKRKNAAPSKRVAQWMCIQDQGVEQGTSYSFGNEMNTSNYLGNPQNPTICGNSGELTSQVSQFPPRVKQTVMTSNPPVVSTNQHYIISQNLVQPTLPTPPTPKIVIYPKTTASTPPPPLPHQQHVNIANATTTTTVPKKQTIRFRHRSNTLITNDMVLHQTNPTYSQFSSDQESR